MLELFPEGFEEIVARDEVELVAYTDAGGEERLWHAFGGVRGDDVAADWRNRWKQFHRAVQVGSLWIGPPWLTLPAGADAVVIEPGRAFGTGSHPTTQLCTELLREVGRGSLVDLGCGSGVLAIVAAKLGFAPVHAFDLDENAVAATRANAAANGVQVVARRTDILSGDVPAADVAVANVTRDVVERLVPRLQAALFIASGYLPTDPVELPPFRHRRRVTRDGWAADLYEAAE